MRRKLFWFGWIVLFALPFAAGAEIFFNQDLPTLTPWKLAIVAAAILLVIFSRNRDQVLKHHLV